MVEPGLEPRDTPGQVSWEPLESDTRNCSPGCATEQARPLAGSQSSHLRCGTNQIFVSETHPSSTGVGAQWGQDSELDWVCVPAQPAPSGHWVRYRPGAACQRLPPRLPESNRASVARLPCRAPSRTLLCSCCSFDCRCFKWHHWGPEVSGKLLRGPG